ncbi:hypothetical protein SCHPADRAFT_906880 [Schizopora paradoxa]|uniref:Uncharacterized protein n=1 Tax=Schizopora paradoxa TaxID=27342 RepID=A0A0H2RFX0_9AGAM|nr:hypothetical protein SCHPADRAFT_906880 [Schizopora paradoxa]
MVTDGNDNEIELLWTAPSSHSPAAVTFVAFDREARVLCVEEVVVFTRCDEMRRIDKER